MIFNDYPRPQFQREKWLNLNGEWNFEITRSSRKPMAYGSKIIVPFSPECKLSGIQRQVQPQEYHFYERKVYIPKEYQEHVILHFGAVDYEAVVFVNDRKVIHHNGGYLPFEVDIAPFLIDHIADIVVMVKDESDQSFHSRGKQKTKRGGIWYTPQSGIWQSVWLEPIPNNYIKKVYISSDFDNGSVSISAEVVGDEKAYAIFNNEKYELPAVISIENPIGWTPENPYLYDITFKCGMDFVRSYFALRKFSVEKDENGVPRIYLNNKICFQNGILDQGYWQDGLYTPPSEEAMVQDILLAKKMGFNVLRKHIKIEPLRWYYYCDKLGMIVWQDFINGGGKYNPICTILPLFLGFHVRDNQYSFFARKSEEGRNEFIDEIKEIIHHLYNCPCIGLWTIFNEGWGQFDSAKIYDIVKQEDSTRLIDAASGWHDQRIGDIVSKHVYFRKYHFKPDRSGRCVLLSEFGGYNFRVLNHCFNGKNFGYRGYKSSRKLSNALKLLYKNQIAPAKKEGLSGAIYTQLSDVEDELNGLITYDRQVVKIDPSIVKKIISI